MPKRLICVAIGVLFLGVSSLPAQVEIRIPASVHGVDGLFLNGRYYLPGKTGTESGGCPRLVLLAHGLLTNQDAMNNIALFIGRHFWVISYDQLGVGGSSKPRPVFGSDMYTVIGDARHLYEVLRQTTTCSKITIVAHSYGALVAVEALSNPELHAEFGEVLSRIDSVVLVAPPTPHMLEVPPDIVKLTKLNRWKVWLGIALGQVKKAERKSNLVSHCFLDNLDKSAAPPLRKSLAKPKVLRANKERAFDLISRMESKNEALMRLEEVSVPVLLISGAQDTLVPSVYAGRLQKTLGNAWHAELSSARHSPQLEWPFEIAKLVEEFIGHRGYGIPRERHIEEYAQCDSDPKVTKKANRRAVRREAQARRESRAKR